MRQGMNVVVKDGSMSNGSFEHAGIITQVWNITGDGVHSTAYATCNVMVFPDCGAPRTATSIYIYPTHAAADREQPGSQYIGWLA